MKKSYISFIGIAFMVCLCLSSCLEDAIEESTPQNGYRINIPIQSPSTKAVTDEGVASFKTTENVYLYNISTSTLETTVLHPASNAAKTQITTDGEEYLAMSYAEGNELKVLYNTNSSGVVDYSSQDGSIDNVIDAGVGTVTITDISGGSITTSEAALDNLQSIFKFTFQCGGNVISGIRFVRIFSSQNKLVTEYNAITGAATKYGPVTVSRNDNLTYIYAGLRFDAILSDEIVFQVVDQDGKVYSGSKAAPSGGFEIGKFYNTSVDVTSHVFSVASGKQVYIAPGNLGKYGSPSSTFSFVEPFTVWFTKASNWYSYQETYPAGTNNIKRTFFGQEETSSANDTPKAFSVYDVNNWKVLKNSEWNYLLLSNEGRTMNGSVKKYYEIKDLSSKYCLLIPPDDATDEDVAGLTAGSVTNNINYILYLKKGFVLLTADGYTNGKTLYQSDTSHGGQYISATIPANGKVAVLRFKNYGTHVEQNVAVSYNNSYSARLVHGIQ